MSILVDSTLDLHIEAGVLSQKTCYRRIMERELIQGSKMYTIGLRAHYIIIGYLRLTLSSVAMAHQEKIVLMHVRDGLKLARYASLSNHETNPRSLVDVLPLLLAVKL
jgi:hypothetical protein